MAAMMAERDAYGGRRQVRLTGARRRRAHGGTGTRMVAGAKCIRVRLKQQFVAGLLERRET